MDNLLLVQLMQYLTWVFCPPCGGVNTAQIQTTAARTAAKARTIKNILYRECKYKSMSHANNPQGLQTKATAEIAL